MTVDTDQKYQENFKAADNVPCRLKQRDPLDKGHDEMAIPAVAGVSHVSSYPLLEFIGLIFIFIMESQN